MVYILVYAIAKLETTTFPMTLSSLVLIYVVIERSPQFDFVPT